MLLICITFTGITYASNALNIQVLFNCMNIKINGDKVNLNNFVYNNITYVPLGKVGELFNKEVLWNGKTKTVSIIDKNIKTDGFYTESDKIKTAIITSNNGNTLELEFQLKNMSGEDITVTLHYPYFDIIIYNENGTEIYKYSKENSDYITLIRDEKIGSGKKYITNSSINLTDKNLLSSETYKVVFYSSFEVKSENRKYKLCEKAYFRIPNIPQTK